MACLLKRQLNRQVTGATVKESLSSRVRHKARLWSKACGCQCTMSAVKCAKIPPSVVHSAAAERARRTSYLCENTPCNYKTLMWHREFNCKLYMRLCAVIVLHRKSWRLKQWLSLFAAAASPHEGKNTLSECVVYWFHLALFLGFKPLFHITAIWRSWHVKGLNLKFNFKTTQRNNCSFLSN